MRVLIVGAGAIGGYFGGRMLQAGRDITFLVRPRRASELAAAGLVIKSPNGDATLKDPPVVQADTIKDKFDVVLLSCKAYDLDDAIKSFAPAVGERTAIIPLLNGMRHLDVLDKKIGASHVLGGLCLTAVTLNEKREVVQLGPGAVAWLRRARRQNVRAGSRHRGRRRKLQFRRRGERDCPAGHVGEMGFPRVERGLDQPDARPDWHDPDGARRQGLPAWHFRRMQGGRDRRRLPPRAPALERATGMLTTEGSPLTASMFRDIKAGQPVEADHVIGDLIARADTAKVQVPRLRTAYTHLKAYEQTRG